MKYINYFFRISIVICIVYCSNYNKSNTQGYKNYSLKSKDSIFSRKKLFKISNWLTSKIINSNKKYKYSNYVNKSINNLESFLRPKNSILKSLLLIPLLFNFGNCQNIYLKESNLDIKNIIPYSRDNLTICSSFDPKYDYLILSESYPSSDIISTKLNETAYVFSAQTFLNEGSKIIVGKQNESGKKLWEKKISLGKNNDIPIKLIEGSDGSFYILATTENVNFPSKNKGLLIKLSSLGIIKAKKLFNIKNINKLNIYDFGFIDNKILVVSNYRNSSNCTNFESVLHFFDTNLNEDSDSYKLKNNVYNRIHLNALNINNDGIFLGGWASYNELDNVPAILRLNDTYKIDWAIAPFFPDCPVGGQIDPTIYNIIETGEDTLVIDGIYADQKIDNNDYSYDIYSWYAEIFKNKKGNWAITSKLSPFYQKFTSSYLDLIKMDNGDLLSSMSLKNQSTIITRISNGNILEQKYLEPIYKKLQLLSLNKNLKDEIIFNALNIYDDNKTTSWFGKTPSNFSLENCLSFKKIKTDSTSNFYIQDLSFDITKEKNIILTSDANLTSINTYSKTSRICYETEAPTNEPTDDPSKSPTNNPTKSPTNNPTKSPTSYPTSYPTKSPTSYPTKSPTSYPTKSPTSYPTKSPTSYPTKSPTSYPTKSPTSYPTKSPTSYPTKSPTSDPTKSPTSYPTKSPTSYPTKSPTSYPTKSPTSDPTKSPTSDPTKSPTNDPTKSPTNDPTTDPTMNPTSNPTKDPTNYPTSNPTLNSTLNPTLNPSVYPTLSPTNSNSIITPIFILGICITLVMCLSIPLILFWCWYLRTKNKSSESLKYVSLKTIKEKTKIIEKNNCKASLLNDDEEEIFSPYASPSFSSNKTTIEGGDETKIN